MLLVSIYFLPFYILYLQKEVTISMEAIGLIFLFVGSAILTYLNYKYIKRGLNHKWLWCIFQIIGILGLLYSIVFLSLLYSLRNCCGF